MADKERKPFFKSDLTAVTGDRASLLRKKAKIHHDDDESGGGHGKAHKGFFKQEKLLKMIEKGRFKIKNFDKFLNRIMGEDEHSLKQSELDKIVEKYQGIGRDKEKQEKNFEKALKEYIEKFLQEEEKLPVADDQEALEKAQAQSEHRTTDAGRRAVIGDKLQGSIIGAHNANPLGLTRQGEIAGATGEYKASELGHARQGWLGADSAAIATSAVQGNFMPGSNVSATFANPQGVTAHAVQGGATGNMLFNNVKTQQQNQAQVQKNQSQKQAAAAAMGIKKK